MARSVKNESSNQKGKYSTERKNSETKLGGGDDMGLCKRFVFVMWSAMLLCVPVNAAVVDKIIAVVNDEIITLTEFNKAFEPYLKNIENNYKGKDKEAVINNAKETFLNRFVDNLLIEQEAKKTGIGIVVKDEEVMDVIKDMIAKRKSNMEDFKKTLAREGSSLESLKKDIKSQIVRMRLLRREIKSKIMVSDEEIGEYYNKNRQDYEGKEAVRIKQIFLTIPEKADKKTKEKIKKEAEQLRKRTLGGEAFELLALNYSQGPGAAQGGDIGFIEKGSIIAAVDSVAFKLPMEQVSEVIESSIGFHIIKIVDKKGAGLKPIGAVREEIKAKLEDEKLEKKYEEWITSIRKRSFIEIKM
jgi:peptidyl-prolyl cis-trans isomerase SurA